MYRKLLIISGVCLFSLGLFGYFQSQSQAAFVCLDDAELAGVYGGICGRICQPEEGSRRCVVEWSTEGYCYVDGLDCEGSGNYPCGVDSGKCRDVGDPNDECTYLDPPPKCPTTTVLNCRWRYVSGVIECSSDDTEISCGNDNRDCE